MRCPATGWRRRSRPAASWPGPRPSRALPFRVSKPMAGGTRRCSSVATVTSPAPSTFGRRWRPRHRLPPGRRRQRHGQVGLPAPACPDHDAGRRGGGRAVACGDVAAGRQPRRSAPGTGGRAPCRGPQPAGLGGGRGAALPELAGEVGGSAALAGRLAADPAAAVAAVVAALDGIGATVGKRAQGAKGPRRPRPGRGAARRVFAPSLPAGARDGLVAAIRPRSQRPGASGLPRRSAGRPLRGGARRSRPQGAEGGGREL